jgi:hypothetical protein
LVRLTAEDGDAAFLSLESETSAMTNEAKIRTVLTSSEKLLADLAWLDESCFRSSQSRKIIANWRISIIRADGVLKQCRALIAKIDQQSQR